jgi:hypothetical protein
MLVHITLMHFSQVSNVIAKFEFQPKKMFNQKKKKILESTENILSLNRVSVCTQPLGKKVCSSILEI